MNRRGKGEQMTLRCEGQEEPVRQSWAASRRGKAGSPVGAGLWEETMRWRGRSQLPLWDRHKAAIRERRQRVCPGWEASCHGCRAVQGLGQGAPACSVPLPFSWHPAPEGAEAPGADWQYLWLRGAGALLPSAGTRCLGCSVLALWWHNHTRPPSLGSPLLPPKPADQIPMSSRQTGYLTAHLSQLAPFSRLLEFSWMKDAMEICKSRAQALVLVSSSALRLSSSQWKI